MLTKHYFNYIESLNLFFTGSNVWTTSRPRRFRRMRPSTRKRPRRSRRKRLNLLNVKPSIRFGLRKKGWSRSRKKSRGWRTNEKPSTTSISWTPIKTARLRRKRWSRRSASTRTTMGSSATTKQPFTCPDTTATTRFWSILDSCNMNVKSSPFSFQLFSCTLGIEILCKI